jgi:hypothetical protein
VSAEENAGRCRWTGTQGRPRKLPYDDAQPAGGRGAGREGLAVMQICQGRSIPEMGVASAREAA